MIELLGLLFFTLAGCLLGIFTGLVPGIHVNLVSILLIGIVLNPYLAAVMIIAMAVTHTFFNFFPSILLGAPDPSTALSVLPGHKMLLESRGVEAIYLTLVGGVGAVFVCVILFPVFFFILPILYQNIQIYGAMPGILIIIAVVMILTESSFRKRGMALVVFLLSGILGYILFNQLSIFPSNTMLFPVFTGLFGISTMLISLGRKTKIPEQDMETPKIPGRLALSGILKGLFSGALVGTLPAIGAAQATVLTQQITRRKDDKEFLVSIGAINTIVAIFSLISLYTISKARSGAAIAVQDVLSSFGFNDMLLLVAVALIATGFSTIIMLKSTKKIVGFMQRLDYTKLTAFIILALVVLVAVFTGATLVTKVIGIFILFLSTCMGLLAPLFGVKRSNLMGVLMLPLIIYYLPI